MNEGRRLNQFFTEDFFQLLKPFYFETILVLIRVAKMVQRVLIPLRLTSYILPGKTTQTRILTLVQY